MNTDTIKRLRELLAKATPGEWTACRGGECQCGMIHGGEGLVATVTRGKYGDTWPTVVVTGDQEGTIGRELKITAKMEMAEYGCVSDELASANAALIPAMKNELPGLLDELERLQASQEAKNFSYVMDVIDRIAFTHNVPFGTWQQRVDAVADLAYGRVKGPLQLDYERAVADRERLQQRVFELEQVSADVCEKCGWAMKFPDEPCRNCYYHDTREAAEKASK
jgi:ribosomal protein L32